jgi:chemotaxis protein CheD
MSLVNGAIHKLSVAGRKCVGIAGLHVATSEGDEIVTYALGSCLGITMYDPVSKVGGLVHVMLPDSSIDKAKAAKQPGMFVDTGVPALIDEMTRTGASRARLRVAVAGGASAKMSGQDHFQIGERNMRAFEAWMSAAGMRVIAAETGGTNCARTMTLSVSNGSVEIKADGATRKLVP